MELTELKERIRQSFKGTDIEFNSLASVFEKDDSVFPFNQYEYLFATMIARGQLSYNDYLIIRNEYIQQNPNLKIFEISAPRGFGEAFAQNFIRSKAPELMPPSRKIDRDYHGQYDLWYDGIRIEVKASRVVDADSEEPLYRKALSSKTNRPFLMNFQQLKPQCCDVFIWMAVYRDVISIWVMNSLEVMNHPDYSKGQHRGNSGNEGQLHIRETNIHSLDDYLLRDDDLSGAVRAAFSRLKI